MKVSFRLTFLVIISLHFSSIKCYSQNVAQIIWTTDSESIPQNSIKSLAPDKYGFLWMTTEKGLVRYDGSNFKTYDSQKLQLHNDRYVYFRGNPEADSLFTFTDYGEDLILINQRNAIKVDSTKFTEASFFDHQKPQHIYSYGTPTVFSETPKTPYRINLRSGNFYLIENQTVALFNKKLKLIFKVKFNYESNANFFAFGDTLFHLKKDGSYNIIRNGKISYQKADLEIDSNSVLFWNIVSQQVFYYANKKLFQITGNPQRLSTILLFEDQNFISHDISSIYLDKAANKIFFGSRKKGLGTFFFKSFSTVIPKLNRNSTQEIFYSLHQFSDNTVISGNGFVMDDRKIIEKLQLESDNFDIAIDQNGDIWTSKFNFLYRYKKSKRFRSPDKWDFKDIISTIYVAKDGNIWFDVAHNRDQEGSLYCFTPEKNPKFNRIFRANFKINYLTQSDAKSLWIGSKKGLHQLIIENKKLISVKETLPLKIRNLHVSDDHNIWISTYENGFFLYRDGRLHSFPKDRNKYLQSAHGIIEHKSFFWIPTNKGLFQVSKQNLLNHIEKKTEVYYYYYNKDYGFLSNEFNGGCQPANVKLPNGNVFLPSMDGVVTLNLECVFPSLPKNEIFIDEAIVDDQNVTINNNSIHLDRNFERVTFFITSPYFGNPNNQSFEARLDGPESQEWSQIDKDNSIVFTNLIPGKYTLTIRKLYNFDSDYIYEKVAIVIEPAFWQTIGFKIFMLFIMVAIILISFNLRIKYIRNLNTVLEKTVNEKTYDLKNTITTLLKTKNTLNRQIENNNKIIQYITHDMKSPLLYLSRVSKRMHEKFDENQEDLKENIESVYTSSAQIYNFVSNLLEYSKVNFSNENLEVSDFGLRKAIQEKTILFEGIAKSQKTVIKNLVPDEVRIRSNKQLISIIIHNLIDNAVKHTYNGIIVFSILYEDNTMFLKISDNGNGFDETTLHYYQSMSENYDAPANRKTEHMGLHIVLELLLIINGKIKFESKINSGTSILIQFGQL